MRLDAPTIDRALAIAGIFIWVIIGFELALGHIQSSLLPLLAVGAVAYVAGVVTWIRRGTRPTPTRLVMSLKLLQLAMLGAVVAVYLARVVAQMTNE